MVVLKAQSTLESNDLWSLEVGAERRGAAWQALLLDGLAAESLGSQDAYKGLSQVPCSYDDVILRDVGRTLPQEELFRENRGKGQSALFRLLRAIAVQHGDIGYVQSLNFVVATLINVFPDDEALVFSCARSMLFRHTLADFYRPSFPQLGVALWQVDRLVEGFLPKAHAALDAHGITAEFYAMQWFLTLFASDLPQNIVVRIWDRFLLVGWQVIAQITLALIATVQDELWELDSCQAMTLLKKFVRTRRWGAESLLLDASKFDVSHRMLSDLEAAHSCGEDPEFTNVVEEKNEGTGSSQWSVQRGRAPKMQHSSSSRSVGSASAEPLPRAFDKEVLRSTSRQGGSTVESCSNSCEREGSKNAAKGTLLPFMIHNLDTGETALMEEEWTAYVHKEHLIKRQHSCPEAAPTLPSAWPGSLPTKNPQSILGGSFWMEGQQLQALRALGKA